MNLRLSFILELGWRTAVGGTVLLGANLAAGADPASPLVRAVVPAPAPATNYDSFRYIGDWNIFNSYRVGHSTGEVAPPPVETITLVGTMQVDQGLYAFFDSPESAYRKTLHEGDTIAQYTVKHITSDQVELTRDSKDMPLAMGQQLRRPPGGDWTVGSAPRVDSAPAASVEPAIPADASDILKRLMEQRQKQLKQ